MDLIEKGVVTGRVKAVHKGQVVASYCMGTRRLYDLLDRNPLFAFHTSDYGCNLSPVSRSLSTGCTGICPHP